MRPYKPAPKNSASANRIRERYLHQLGLQRGTGAPLTAPLPYPNSNHVVVISGLPSLPEDRATTAEHVLESHDFSISRHSQQGGSVEDANSSGGDGAHQEDNMMEGDASRPLAHSLTSRSTLSVGSSSEAGEDLTSMALAYPNALLKVPPPAKATPPPNNNNTLPFSLSHSVPWRGNSLSKPASVLLDSNADHDSVSSAGTSTTAESSLTAAQQAAAAMVSRDWGAVPHHTTSAGVSLASHQGGESPASTPGVYFQCGHPRLLGGNVNIVQQGSSGAPHCATSSLAHALNRFNIDSDCEASIASNSIVEDHMMDDDDASFDDNASRSSVASHTSTGSHRAGARKKKIGKTQRLMDRAAAHERILQIRNDRSQKMRATLVHSQRMMGAGSQVASGLSAAMSQEVHLSESPGGSTVSSQGSILMHVQHGKTPSQAPAAATASLTPTQAPATSLQPSMCDLGRTPTSSNCSDVRKFKALGPPSAYLTSLQALPAGVHVSSDRNDTANSSVPQDASRPLVFHPELASRIPTPPPKAIATGVMMPPPPSFGGANNNMNQVDSSSHSVSSRDAETREGDDAASTSSASLQYMNHQATVDDVMEVAMTLSKLGNARTTGPIPRFR